MFCPRFAPPRAKLPSSATTICCSARCWSSSSILALGSNGLRALPYVFEKVGAESSDTDYLAPWRGKELWFSHPQLGEWQIYIRPNEGDVSYPTTLVIDPEKLFSEVLARAGERRTEKVA